MNCNSVHSDITIKNMQVKIIEINRNVGCGEAKVAVNLLCLFCINYCFTEIRLWKTQ